jgi:hypothetical protein
MVSSGQPTARPPPPRCHSTSTTHTLSRTRSASAGALTLKHGVHLHHGHGHARPWGLVLALPRDPRLERLELLAQRLDLFGCGVVWWMVGEGAWRAGVCRGCVRGAGMWCMGMGGGGAEGRACMRMAAGGMAVAHNHAARRGVTVTCWGQQAVAAVAAPAHCRALLWWRQLGEGSTPSPLSMAHARPHRAPHAHARPPTQPRPRGGTPHPPTRAAAHTLRMRQHSWCPSS